MVGDGPYLHVDVDGDGGRWYGLGKGKVWVWGGGGKKRTSMGKIGDTSLLAGGDETVGEGKRGTRIWWAGRQAGNPPSDGREGPGPHR